jgi:hypothetical protein
LYETSHTAYVPVIICNRTQGHYNYRRICEMMTLNEIMMLWTFFFVTTACVCYQCCLLLCLLTTTVIFNVWYEFVIHELLYEHVLWNVIWWVVQLKEIKNQLITKQSYGQGKNLSRDSFTNLNDTMYFVSQILG